MTGRVYVPTTWSGLRQVVTADGIGPAPFFGHAVTRALRAAWPDGGDEELEYAATTNAARTSLGLLTDDDPPRRVVLAVDAETVIEADDEDPTVVEVGEVVPMRLVAAVLVDIADAADDVSAARGAWAAALGGDGDAEAVVDRCQDDHDLAWFAVQEIGELLTWE